MKVSIDGGVTWIEADEARVIYDGVGCEEKPAELHLTATSEGLIQDVYIGAFDSYLGATSSNTAQEIVDNLTA